MCVSQRSISLNETRQLLTRLNRTDGQNVLSLYPVSMSHALQFPVVVDWVEMPRRGKRNRGDSRRFDAVRLDDVTPRVLRKRQNFCSASCRAADRQSKLKPAAAMKRFRQVFEREIVNADHHRTRTKRRRRELHVQNVHRMLAQFGAECQWYAD